MFEFQKQKPTPLYEYEVLNYTKVYLNINIVDSSYEVVFPELVRDLERFLINILPVIYQCRTILVGS
jgi:hypothetical protein